MGLSHQHSVTLVPPVAWSGVAPRDPQLSHPRTDGLGLLGGQPSGGSRRHPLKPAALCHPTWRRALPSEAQHHPRDRPVTPGGAGCLFCINFYQISVSLLRSPYQSSTNGGLKTTELYSSPTLET